MTPAIQATTPLVLARMGKKHEYHGVRVPVLAESYERCVECIMVCFAIISLGPNTLSNAQIVRYNHHDFLDICMRFLTIPRAAKQHDAADNLIQICTCLNDDSPLIDALLETYYNDVPAQRIERPAGKKQKNTSVRGSGDLDTMSDERELEYEEAYLRGEIGNFLDILHEYRSHEFEWGNSLDDVLRNVSDYVSAPLQPFHDRRDLHKFKDTGKRRMWPARAEHLLPFGPRDTIAGLGWTALRSLCWPSTGIAAVIPDVVKGPTVIAVVDSCLPAAFVVLGATGISDLKKLLVDSRSPGRNVVLDSISLLVRTSHLSLLGAAMLSMSVPNLRQLNARSLEQTGGLTDIHHVSNAWIIALGLFVGLDNYPVAADTRQRCLRHFTRLCVALHHALGFASVEPPDPSLEPEWLLHQRRGDVKRTTELIRDAAFDLLLSDTGIRNLDIVYEVQRLASGWASTTRSLVGAAFLLFYKLSERRCWAVSGGTYCTTSRALNPDRFKRCAECWHVRYCSRECQKAAWREEHKRICAVVRRVSDILRVPRELDAKESSAVHDLMEATAAENWTPALIADLEKLASHFEPILDSVA
ncbi:hypothetical protein EXIGLDRAFT_749365 [Exidia glandulosa HHB12029]|uniref:MYND-type domain-containing protein n=1 Tax=Exidia glandulosa HHB12029 TaxID=1314781 RepID=A0A165I7Y9_EXIGL|nr:hypothetical protein EXIGLDRAFT_749365 [Exidia glandulosa HHB12029]